MTEDTIRPLSEHPARHCPTCGARVTDEAETCAICDTPLRQEEPEEEQAEAPARRLALWQIAVMGVVAILILGGSVALGMNLGRNEESIIELPTFTPTITFTPTRTATPTQTPTSTATSTPRPTPTPVPPQEYTVQAGDTLGGIALEYDMTVEELIAYNNLDSEFINVGEILLIPPPTPTLAAGEPTLTPAPFLTHIVKAGDTLSTIAEQYNVAIEDVRAANDIPADSEMIRPGEALVIPQYTPTPPPQDVALVTSTPTPGVVSYPAPVKLYPPDGTIYHGPDAVIALQWASVGILEEREYYNVELIVPTAEGNTTLNTYTRATAWRVPQEHFPPEEVTERTFSWRVHVVRQITESADPDYKAISPMLRRHTFIWNSE